MKAKLHTPNYRIPDLELVTGFEVRRGEEFTIALNDVPEGSSSLSDEDPVLDVSKIQPVTDSQGESFIKVKALKEGVSWLHVRKDDQETLVKKWRIEVFSDEGTSLRSSISVESRS
jgi:hypothetical protein